MLKPNALCFPESDKRSLYLSPWRLRRGTAQLANRRGHDGTCRTGPGRSLVPSKEGTNGAARYAVSLGTSAWVLLGRGALQVPRASRDGRGG